MTGQPTPVPADLRQRTAEALMRWAEGNNNPKYAPIRRPETVTKNAYARADAVLAELRPELDLLTELTRARQHGAYTFCEQLVGHVTVGEFARKIAEKRDALAQREEAVRYANDQKQRAEQAEQQRDHLAAVLREILIREATEQPVAAEDYARWAAALNQSAPAHDAGPSMREAAADDRRWDLEKAGE